MKRKLRSKEIKVRRQADILDAAAEIFAKTGYHLTDVEVIADRLGVGKGTIYRYFPTKQKLFTAVMEQMMKKLAGQMASKIGSITNPIDKLKAVIRSHMEFFGNNIHLLEIFIHYRSEYKIQSKKIYLKHYARGFRGTEKLVQQCVDLGLIKKIPPRAIANLLTDIFYGILFTTFLGVSKKSFLEKGKYLEEVFINNLLL
ncbi:MAG: TetR/AcrR family transcriptional regulator [Candidatus Brocadiia bacterium]